MKKLPSQLLRLAAVIVTVTVVSSCSSPDLPKVRLGTSGLLEAKAVLRDDRLAKELSDVQATDHAAGTAATEKFIVNLQQHVHLHGWKTPLRIEGKAGGYELQFHSKSLLEQGKPEWSPAFFDRLLPASSFKLEGYNQIASGDGAGAPVVLAFEDIKKARRERSFRPGNEMYAPGTVVLEFGKPKDIGYPTPVKCRIINTFTQRNVNLEGRSLPLAYNVTVAVESNLGNTYILGNGLSCLLRPDKRLNDVGVFGIDAYDRNKIPVLFVHGLDSDPSIWKNAVNEIYATPGLNARYVPLLFMYPTGLSVPASAARLRQAILKYRDLWDPKQDAPGFDQMVLVGHSMGGLLSRLQTIDSGDDLWEAFFSRPISDVPFIAEHERKSTEAILKFEHLPFVKRVIFVAVPHKGSKVADMGLVRLATRLIKMPVQLAEFSKTALLESPSLFNPALLRYHSLGRRGVDMLSPGHPFFVAIDKRHQASPLQQAAASARPTSPTSSPIPVASGRSAPA